MVEPPPHQNAFFPQTIPSSQSVAFYTPFLCRFATDCSTVPAQSASNLSLTRSTAAGKKGDNTLFLWMESNDLGVQLGLISFERGAGSEVCRRELTSSPNFTDPFLFSCCRFVVGTEDYPSRYRCKGTCGEDFNLTECVGGGLPVGCM
jgi:hypothetical protein